MEISGRKYDPALTQTERVLWGGVRLWACITENKSISAARTTTQPHIRWHMGAYDDAFRGGSRALNEAQDKCALVLALHHADMQATQEENRREGIL